MKNKTGKTEYRKLPRILVAAPGSGSGKTVFTCALLRTLQRKGLQPSVFKCGPDYIDPMFHRKVLHADSGNLDRFFESREGIRKCLAESEGTCAVLEGVMGIYDGLEVTGTEGSCYEIAADTETPVLLVVNAGGSGRTLIPEILGILRDDTEGLIRAIVLNRMSEHFYGRFRTELERRLSEEGFPVSVAGYVPRNEAADWDSRHLGLMLPDEIAQLGRRIDTMSELIGETVDTDLLRNIMEQAADLPVTTGDGAIQDKRESLTLAVARDEAFCFYYQENLKVFQERGVKLLFFSPIHDRSLPPEADGLLLGGGYPELHLKELAENEEMRRSIRRRIGEGIPSLAECGGFMYLHDSIYDRAGQAYPMVGVLKGECRYTGHLVRFGYLRSAENSMYAGLKGHEFHYYESSDPGSDMVICRPDGSRARTAMHAGGDHLWGFPHFYYASKPELLDALIERMGEYHAGKQS